MPALSTIGVKVSYAIETTAYERPTEGYKRFPGFKETPETNPQPETADATTFDNEKYTTSIRLLKSLDGALTFTANYTPELVNFYEHETQGVLALYEAAKQENKAMWLCIDVPGIEKSVFIQVEPVELGSPSLTQNSLAETNVYFVQTGEPESHADPRYASTSYKQWLEYIATL